MTKKEKIGTYQMFCVMLLCRMTALFTFMLPTTAFLQSGDRILSVIPLFFIELFYAFLTVFTLKSNGGQSVITAAKEISGLSGRITAVYYILFFIWFAGISVSRFELFISTAVFPNSELYLMTVILIAASLYAALKGPEATSRGAVIITAVLLASILFIILTVAGEFRFYNLKPLLLNGVMPVAGFAFYVSSRTVEFAALQINAPLIEGNIRKMAVIWTLSVSIISAVIFLVLAGVTGEYGDDQIFPLYTLTVIARFGIFERLDDILTGLWVLCSFIQLAFLILTASLCASQGFNKAKKLPVCILSSLGVFIVYLFTSKTVTQYSEMISSRLQDLAYITAVLLIPLSVTVILRLKRRKRKL